MQVYGIDAIIRLVTHLAFIYLAFWSLQSVKIEMIFKKNVQRQIRMFYVFVSIFLGYTTSTFFLEIIVLLKNFLLAV